MNPRSRLLASIVILFLMVYLGLHQLPIKRIFIRKTMNPKKEKCSSFPCFEKPTQDSLSAILAFASLPKNQIHKLSGPCQEKEYTWATLGEQRLRIMNAFTKMALSKLNQKAREYAQQTAKRYPKSVHNENRILQPFFFKFIQVINATSSVDKEGNSRWRVDVMVEEMTLHFSLRLMLDFTIYVQKVTPKGKKILSCAEYTTFPFPRYFQGYPTLQGSQVIPLPTQVIVTGRDVLSKGGIDCDWPRFKAMILNRCWMENSDLALGTELKTTLFRHTAPGQNDTSLASSAYPKKRLLPKDIQLPEKNYADYLESSGQAVNTDIINDYTLKPKNYADGVPENSYHLQGSSQTYGQSVQPPNYPKGWIQPAVLRNKWPRLWSEPRDRFAWPCYPVGQDWDNLGILRPVACPNNICPGIRSSTQQQPRTPQYWPTITGLPNNNGPNYWLFNNLRGGNATDGAAHPTR